jgi:hypothetical protein
MSNTNTATLAAEVAREFNLFLGTYWFDFEQAAESAQVLLAPAKDTSQNTESKPTEGQVPDYSI